METKAKVPWRWVNRECVCACMLSAMPAVLNEAKDLSVRLYTVDKKWINRSSHAIYRIQNSDHSPPMNWSAGLRSTTQKLNAKATPPTRLTAATAAGPERHVE